VIEKLTLVDFKNFCGADLLPGDFTLLVGANASGKSNLRDAFRFLHGISRGYTLAEIIGEKWGEGGRQWNGIRGGTSEVAYLGESSFKLQVSLEGMYYRIDVALPSPQAPPFVIEEMLHRAGQMVFDVSLDDPKRVGAAPPLVSARFAERTADARKAERGQFLQGQPILPQVAARRDVPTDARKYAASIIESLASIRFLDLLPDAMRRPSLPGQDILGGGGENLSSVLQAICANEDSKRAVLEWIKELTPQDVVDFEFVPDQTGKILVSLVESNGSKTSAYSASDGTLRFLAMIAALLGPNPSKLYFFEELDNGIHPTRLHLLLQLIEQCVKERDIQVVATTHSPQLLGFLSEKARESASLIYRLEGQPDARIRRIVDIPEARRVLETQDLAQLHSSGWLEDAVAFTEAEQASS